MKMNPLPTLGFTVSPAAIDGIVPARIPHTMGTAAVSAVGTATMGGWASRCPEVRVSSLGPSPRIKTRFIRTLPMSGSGFTIVEILVVIGIMAVLAVLLMAISSSMIRRANMTKSSGNLRQIGVAMMAYAGEHNGYHPPPLGQLSDGSSFNPHGWWWAVHLLPFTGRDVKIFDRPGMTKTWSDPASLDPVTRKPFRIGYWINGGNDPNVPFCHGAPYIANIDSGKNYMPLVGFPKPSRTVGIIDGIGGSAENMWNPDSRGNWRSGSNSKYHRWSGEKVDDKGLNAEGKLPKGSFNVLWLDGHVSLENSSSLKTEDFLREK